MAKRDAAWLLLEDTASPGDAPFMVRLRKALKSHLRTYGLRCRRVVMTDDPTALVPPAPQAADPAPEGAARG